MKKILLIYKNEGLSEVFETELRRTGYDVTAFYIHPIGYNDFRMTDILEKKFRGVFLRDRTFIHKLHDRAFLRYNKRRLKELKSANSWFDYCLSIHGEMAPEFVLRWARSVSKTMVDYQPDGILPANKITEFKKFYDRIFVFDPADIHRYPELNAKTATNFFTEEIQDIPEKFDFFYIGNLANDRLKILEELHRHLGAKYSSNFILGISPWDTRQDSEAVKFITSHTSYRENIGMVKEARCLIDIKRPEHGGLSFRVFEALKLRKKLITNNPAVKNYDFYHPDNIHITEDFTDYKAIEEFMEKPLYNLDEKIINHYSFASWIKNILNA